MPSDKVNSQRLLNALAVPILFLSMCLTTFTTTQKASATSDISEKESTEQMRLESGEVLVNCQDIKGTKYVVARILIDESPERLWPTLVNPYEFKGKICHKMKKVAILADEPHFSKLDYRVSVIFPIPDVDYVVESHYTTFREIDFQRVSGSFRDLKGFWKLEPCDKGNKTELTYSMYLDPGFPVPDWVIRQGVRSELPTVLTALRDRVNVIHRNNAAAEKRNIVASINVIGSLPQSAVH